MFNQCRTEQGAAVRQRTHVLALPFGHGAGRQGCAKGPEALFAAGLYAALDAQASCIETLALPCDQPVQRLDHPNPALKALSQVRSATTIISQRAYEISAEARPVFVGGDHAIAAGTLPAMARHAQTLGRPLFVLWLDAHPDFHTLDTTRSGNLHGVPLAYATGQPGFADYYPALDYPIDPANICMLGLRSVDAAERRLLARCAVRMYGMDNVKINGIACLIKPFLDQVRQANGLLHVSFDVDCLDPVIAPAVGTPVPDGLSLDDARKMMDLLSMSGLVSSLDLVEFNPDLDEQGRTAGILVNLLARLFGTSLAALTSQAA
jgi:arginase